jgi:hypothetical protein
MCAGHLVRLLAVGACGARLSVTPIVHLTMLCPLPGRQCRCRMCVCDPQLGATFIYLSIYFVPCAHPTTSKLILFRITSEVCVFVNVAFDESTDQLYGE